MKRRSFMQFMLGAICSISLSQRIAIQELSVSVPKPTGRTAFDWFSAQECWPEDYGGYDPINDWKEQHFQELQDNS